MFYKNLLLSMHINIFDLKALYETAISRVTNPEPCVAVRVNNIMQNLLQLAKISPTNLQTFLDNFYDAFAEYLETETEIANTSNPYHNARACATEYQIALLNYIKVNLEPDFRLGVKLKLQA